MQHKTVLLQEAVNGLDLKKDSIVVDATFGSGGHAREIVAKLNKSGLYIGIDTDATALDRTKIGDCAPQVHLVYDNFSNITNIIKSLQINAVDAILADLGWRMEQFTAGGKGFSFMQDEPLHMTFDKPENYSFTAADIVNDWDEHVIADIIYGYSEEKFARRIARAIVEARRNERITTTTELVDIIKSALPKGVAKQKIHPATRTFQALRIAVNEELSVLEKFIKEAFLLLKPGGKMAIITFHSIEDRIVKHSFREIANSGQVKLTPKKPIVPGAEELKENPRARSAKLRIITKL